MSKAEEKLYEFADTVKREGQEAKSYLKTKMAGKKTYGPPTRIPQTPSSVINEMLETRCNKTFDNPLKFGVASYVCLLFFAINRLYGMLYQDRSRSSHTMWMAACGLVSVGMLLQSYLLYQIIIGCSFLAHNLLYYGFILLGLSGIALGGAGAVFFEKGPKISSTFSSSRSSGKSE